MLNRMRELLRDEQGFTLVELMVVIVILGILAGIGIPTYNNFVKRAYQAEVEVAARTLKLGLELYRFDNDGKYPATRTAGEDGSIKLEEIFVPNDSSRKLDDYVSDWPEDNVIIVSYDETGTFELKHKNADLVKEYSF